MKYPSITSAEDIPAALRDMRLSAMAAAFEEDMKNPNSNLKTFTERFSDIVRAEQDYRKNRKTNKGCLGVLQTAVFRFDVRRTNHKRLPINSFCNR